jgi:FtsP/CotA-like multicopper oxidase with cupredoxin domain
MSLVYRQQGNQQLPCNIDPRTKQCEQIGDGGGADERPGTAQVLATVSVVAAQGDGLPDATTIPGHPVRQAHENLAHVPIKGSCSDAKPITGLPTAPAGESCRRDFLFSYNTKVAQFALIDGQAFSAGMRPEAAPYLGTVEEWRLINNTSDDHPFHIHVNGFQVIATTADDPAGALHTVTVHGHQDIVTIPKRFAKGTNGEVIIRQRFETYTGWFVFHCHILQHEDAGMMATIQVRHHGETVRPAPNSVGETPHGMVNQAAGLMDTQSMHGMPGM